MENLCGFSLSFATENPFLVVFDVVVMISLREFLVEHKILLNYKKFAKI
jgi:hypothetical protein